MVRRRRHATEGPGRTAETSVRSGGHHGSTTRGYHRPSSHRTGCRDHVGRRPRLRSDRVLIGRRHVPQGRARPGRGLLRSVGPWRGGQSSVGHRRGRAGGRCIRDCHRRAGGPSCAPYERTSAALARGLGPWVRVDSGRPKGDTELVGGTTGTPITPAVGARRAAAILGTAEVGGRNAGMRGSAVYHLRRAVAVSLRSARVWCRGASRVYAVQAQARQAPSAVCSRRWCRHPAVSHSVVTGGSRSGGGELVGSTMGSAGGSLERGSESCTLPNA